jgi:hypothetical protein
VININIDRITLTPSHSSADASYAGFYALVSANDDGGLWLVGSGDGVRVERGDGSTAYMPLAPAPSVAYVPGVPFAIAVCSGVKSHSVHQCTELSDPETGDTRCKLCIAWWHAEMIAMVRAIRGRWMVVRPDGEVSRHRSLSAARAEARRWRDVFGWRDDLGDHARVLRYRRDRAPIDDEREERIAPARWRP